MSLPGDSIERPFPGGGDRSMKAAVMEEVASMESFATVGVTVIDRY